MAEQWVYVPHSLGTLIGSRQVRAWLARDAQTGIEQTVTPPWRGQPAFPTAADAFAWIGWGRQQPWLPDGLAVAHLDVHPDLSEGIHRIHVGPTQLRAAANQIVRPPGATGPDPQVLAACHGIARAEAMRAWLRAPIGTTARDQRHVALSAVWAYGYQIAARDGHTGLAEQLAHAVHTILADPSRATPRAHSAAELRRIDQSAALLAADTTVGSIATTLPGDTVADLPDEVFEKAGNAERAAGHQHGWDAAVAVAWQEALRLGALHGAMGAATDAYTLWRTHPAGGSRTAAIDGRLADQWLKDRLRDASRDICAQWLLAAARPLPPPHRQPDAATAPTIPDPQPSTTEDRPAPAASSSPVTSPAGHAFPTAAAAPQQPHPSAAAGCVPREPHGRRR